MILNNNFVELIFQLESQFSVLKKTIFICKFRCQKKLFISHWNFHKVSSYDVQKCMAYVEHGKLSTNFSFSLSQKLKPYIYFENFEVACKQFVVVRKNFYFSIFFPNFIFPVLGTFQSLQNRLETKNRFFFARETIFQSQIFV